MIATRHVRTLEVSAASGLVLRDGLFHVVADDENALFVFGPDGPTRRIALLGDELPTDSAVRKRKKRITTTALFSGPAWSPGIRLKIAPIRLA